MHIAARVFVPVLEMLIFHKPFISIEYITEPVMLILNNREPVDYVTFLIRMHMSVPLFVRIIDNHGRADYRPYNPLLDGGGDRTVFQKKNQPLLLELWEPIRQILDGADAADLGYIALLIRLACRTDVDH